MTPGVAEAANSLKRLLQGAVGGAIVTMIVGLTWGGWTLQSTPETFERWQADFATARASCTDRCRVIATGGERSCTVMERKRVDDPWDHQPPIADEK
jgi:hypothetical protein